jgi:biopolymer transport protein ExbB
LNAAFDANEKKLTELQAQLDAKGGNLGELFGVTRTIANDFSSVVYNSIITAEFPDRDAFVSGLAKSKELPSIDELERLWFEMQREATESGKVVKYTGNVVLADGKPTQTDVVRIGPFNAVADGDYTSYLPSEKQLAVLSRQPGSPYSGLADDIMDAEATGYHEMTVDPTRGVLLAITVQRPNLVERIEQGELVGLIIIAVGIVGAVLGMYQLWYLLGVSRRVKAQLANLANPVDDNPLGRVLNAFKGDAAKLENDPEVVELRLSEAVLREVPMLERFQAFLRLAVAAGPLLGLVGTVVGMIITFQSITESGSGDPKLMAAGISQAMIATVLGLGIAVPLLFMNAVLMSRSKGIIQILDEQSTGLLAERLESRKGRG